MKKTLALLLALVMVLSLCACGGGNVTKASEENEPKEQETTSSQPKIGDTVHGKTGDFTVTSVEVVDKIENGYYKHLWSPAEKEYYEDVTAEEGYSIVKVSYHFDYTSKSNGNMVLKLALNYDNGYVFEGNGNHALPAIESKVRNGYEERYDFPSSYYYFEVNDPLEFEGFDACAYIFVNETAITDEEKPFVLEVGIPTEPLSFDNTSGGLIEDLLTFDYFEIDVR